MPHVHWVSSLQSTRPMVESHKVFSQLYDAMVQPIIDYGAAV